MSAMPRPKLTMMMMKMVMMVLMMMQGNEGNYFGEPRKRKVKKVRVPKLHKHPLAREI